MEPGSDGVSVDLGQAHRGLSCASSLNLNVQRQGQMTPLSCSLSSWRGLAPPIKHDTTYNCSLFIGDSLCFGGHRPSKCLLQAAGLPPRKPQICILIPHCVHHFKPLLLWKMEGAACQGMPMASRNQNRQENTSSPKAPRRKHSSDNTLISAQGGSGQTSDLQNYKTIH